MEVSSVEGHQNDRGAQITACSGDAERIRLVLLGDDVPLGNGKVTHKVISKWFRNDYQSSSPSCTMQEWDSGQEQKQVVSTTCQEKNFHHKDKQQWNRLPRKSVSLSLQAFLTWVGKSPDQPGLNSALIAGGCEFDSLPTWVIFWLILHHWMFFKILKSLHVSMILLCLKLWYHDLYMF